MGAIIGGFLIGRPYPLFFKMFQYAASTHNPFYGALSFVLIGLGNILIMALLFLALSATRFQQWLQATPRDSRAISRDDDEPQESRQTTRHDRYEEMFDVSVAITTQTPNISIK